MQGLKFILNQYKEITADMDDEKTYKKVYRIDILFDKRTISFDSKEGYSLSNKTVDGVRRVIDKRNDIDVKKGRITNGLKMKMSYQEMENHMRENSWKSVNRVNVGLYAKRLGYKVYKPMINGRICLLYVNEHIEIGNGEHSIS